jgi:hypothetical protein
MHAGVKERERIVGAIVHGFTCLFHLAASLKFDFQIKSLTLFSCLQATRSYGSKVIKVLQLKTLFEN